MNNDIPKLSYEDSGSDLPADSASALALERGASCAETGACVLGWSQAETVRAVILSAMVVLPFFALVFEHISRVQEREHYEFVIFLPVAAALLAWKRRLPISARGGGARCEGDARTEQRRAVFTAAGCVAGFGLLLLGELVYSPWTGMIGALCMIAALILMAGGFPAWSRFWPAWFVLALAVPPPMALDQEIVGILQDWATRISSRTLDILGILHIRNGNILDVPGERIFVSKACSGIQSLLITWALTVIIGFWYHRRFWEILALLAYATLLVLAVNIARILIVCIAWIRWHANLFSKTAHETVGLIAFGVICLTMLSADRWIHGAFSRSQFPLRFRKSPTAIPQPQAHAAPAWKLWTFSAGLGVALTLILAPQFWTARGLMSPRINAVPELAFPDRIGDWRIASAGDKDFARPLEQIFQSRIWKCTHNGLDLNVHLTLDRAVSIDHDLELCYRKGGWRIIKRSMLPTGTGTDSETAGTAWMLDLQLPAERLLAHVLFTGLDNQGGIPDSQAYQPQDWRTQLRNKFLVGAKRPVYYQFQIYGEHAKPLTPLQETALIAFFRTMEVQVRTQLRQRNAPPVPPAP